MRPPPRPARLWFPGASHPGHPARPAARSARPSTPPRRLRVAPLSLDRKDACHRVEGRDVGPQAFDLELALQQLERYPAPDLVVVHRQPEQPDLQVAQAHHGVRVGADGELAPRLEAVVNDQVAALEVEGHALIDVRDPDADARLERVEVALLARIAAYVGLYQAPEHRRERARLIVRVQDLGAAVDVEFGGGLPPSAACRTPRLRFYFSS